MSPPLRSLAIASALMALHVSPGLAQRGGGGGNSCTVSVTGVAFGAYDVFSGSPVLSTGSVTLQCGPAARNIMVSLSPGQGGSYSPRTLANGGEALSYNLYLDAARTMVWGDGTGGTQQYTNPEPPDTVLLTIYGAIPALQDVSAGGYTDNVVASVNF